MSNSRQFNFGFLSFFIYFSIFINKFLSQTKVYQIYRKLGYSIKVDKTKRKLSKKIRMAYLANYNFIYKVGWVTERSSSRNPYGFEDRLAAARLRGAAAGGATGWAG